MKVRYRDSKDPRITKKKSFLKEYFMILSVMLVCCSGAVLMFNEFMLTNTNPWIMVLDISSYVFFMGLLVSLATRYVMNTGFHRPLVEFGQAARKVAQGDFTIQLKPKRKDGQKDEMEVFIEDFNKMVKELYTIETLKGDFIANISHEIKTPLAIIQNYAVYLRKADLTVEEKESYISTIIEASKKLSTLVTNVLRLNKLDSQEIIQKEKFSLDEQLRQCILLLDEKFEEKNLNLEIMLEDVMIESDENLLEIVWNNLLTNAIKFTPDHGRIEIYLKKEKNMAKVTIKDSGCGMDENTCNHIFDRFYQGDTSHFVEGNGLGLALVKRVVDLAGGKITVSSEVGKGSTFCVEI